MNRKDKIKIPLFFTMPTQFRNIFRKENISYFVTHKIYHCESNIILAKANIPFISEVS